MINNVRVMLVLFGLLLFGGLAAAQTPFASRNVAGAPTAPANQPPPPEGAAVSSAAPSASPANPWVGAQIGYKFGGTTAFQDNLIVNAQLLHDIELGTTNFRLPVMGNISGLTAHAPANDDESKELAQKGQELMDSASGVRVGLYPYYEFTSIRERHSWLSVVLQGETAWKLNAFKKEGIEDSLYL